jgi:hypothetical protein
MRCYYANASLTYLDQTHRLSHGALAGLAIMQEEQVFKPALERLGHLPSPEVMIRQLLRV